MAELSIGKVSHYYSKIGVAIVDLTGDLRVGQQVHIKGHTTDLTEVVDSIQIEHESVAEAKAGACVGLRVKEKVREGDEVLIEV